MIAGPSQSSSSTAPSPSPPQSRRPNLDDQVMRLEEMMAWRATTWLSRLPPQRSQSSTDSPAPDPDGVDFADREANQIKYTQFVMAFVTMFGINSLAHNYKPISKVVQKTVIKMGTKGLPKAVSNTKTKVSSWRH
ncbi:UNVERIFIED_CONTAM: hypothetical protein Sradi_2109200 [Sesamum radiatum]|uniref:Uncharacterized protein n=1 Tax=Sesamum radiatum TaxID=300843 RepID=A0AAW2TJ31_SESRA